MVSGFSSLRERLGDGRAPAGAFLRRDAAIARSYRLAFVLQFLSTATVALVFYFVAQVADRTALLELGVAEGKYFPFVVVGIAVLGVLDAGLLGPSRALRSDQVNGTLEPLLATPFPAWAIVAAGPTYETLKTVALGGAILGFAALLGVDISGGTGGVLLASAIVVPALIMITGAGLALAAVTLLVRRAEHISSFVSVAIGLACGIYYPIEVLPSTLETVARVLPPTWFVDLERAALFGGEIVVWKIAGVVLAAVVASIIGAVGLDRALRVTRRRGTLTHY